MQAFVIHWGFFAMCLCTVYCDDNTYMVTDEAWFDIEIKDADSTGEDYRGRIVIALFGKAAPITTTNFKFIARGYKAGPKKVSFRSCFPLCSLVQNSGFI